MINVCKAYADVKNPRLSSGVERVGSIEVCTCGACVVHVCGIVSSLGCCGPLECSPTKLQKSLRFVRKSRTRTREPNLRAKSYKLRIWMNIADKPADTMEDPAPLTWQQRATGNITHVEAHHAYKQPDLPHCWSGLDLDSK